MLEERIYTIDEIAAALKTGKRRQSIKKKLESNNVEFEISGRGRSAMFDIKKINEPYKLYCKMELGFSGQCDFEKMLYVHYEFLNSDKYVGLKKKEKKKYMDKKYIHISRQTISNNIKRLENLGWIHFSSDNCKYYFSSKGVHVDCDKEKYSEAWAYYFEQTGKCGRETKDVIGDIIRRYGGVPRKHLLPDINVLNSDEINAYNDILCAEMERRFSPNN